MGTSESKKKSTSSTSCDVGQCETQQDIPLQEIPPCQSNACDTLPHFIYYFKIFLDLGYFFLVIPFRLKLKIDRTTGTKTFRLHSHILQQATCAVLQAIVVFELISVLRLLPGFKEMRKKPQFILQSANLVASLIYTLSLLYIFWFRKSNIESICELLQDVGSLSNTKQHGPWEKIRVCEFFILYIAWNQSRNY